MRTRDYSIRWPRDVTVVAACEQVRCDNWLHGWDTLVDERTGPGRDAAGWIRSGQSGRTFRELPGAADGGVTVFRFEPHQRCFAEHRTRPSRFLAGRREVPTLGDWIGDLDDHVGHLEDQLRKG
jgi:hypothetical protein